ncbi:lipoyl(octanoyl) transferase LipB [Mariprofundus ferrooxydans]|nr:lipoyl(octanoyl) transferase LipB [Mariprofundus ferrooxydans]
MHIIHHSSQDYPDSIAEQEALVAAILSGEAVASVIFTEHPPLFTVGTSGSDTDILSREIDGQSIALHASGRGGEVTYHGPGQLLCYVLADLRQNQDLHQHVFRLEEMIIRTLAEFSISADRDSRGIGVWVDGKKIAAIGVRCRKWITFHGIALNINPNLKHFSGIVACGMKDSPVTSMQQLGKEVSREQVEQLIARHSILFD